MIALGLVAGAPPPIASRDPEWLLARGSRARGPCRQPRRGARGRRLPDLGRPHRTVSPTAFPPSRSRSCPRPPSRQPRRAPRLPEQVPHRGRSLLGWPRRAARGRPRVGLRGRSSRRLSTTACTSRTGPRMRRSSARCASEPPAGALGATLSGSGPTVIVWARSATRRRSARSSSPTVSPTSRCYGSRPPRRELSSSHERPVRSPVRPRQAAQRRPHRRPRARPGARDAQGDRASPTRISRDRWSASQRPGSRRCRATSTSASWRST